MQVRVHKDGKIERHSGDKIEIARILKLDSASNKSRERRRG
jgi:hypothetical protein